ncbi:glutathione binding-like protein [Burkholderia sp. AU28863]|uniref:glutathione binding-like protein n=1 Tax=Burkholderia sp. AU28863 TaxID=2015352 RepID=UPI00211ADE59|nr:glutathione binding-like protein [Burkholderia sp. AU28863]
MLARQPFLAGDAVTLADIAAGTYLYRNFELDIARPDVPPVTAWYERLKARPTYRTHVTIPFDDLRGTRG